MLDNHHNQQARDGDNRERIRSCLKQLVSQFHEVRRKVGAEWGLMSETKEYLMQHVQP